MKKIINGKKYNTETAKFLGSVSYGYPNDFNWYEESLYQTKSGNFLSTAKGARHQNMRKNAGKMSGAAAKQ